MQVCTIISTRLGRISHMYSAHACYELYQTSRVPFLIHWTELFVCWVPVAPQDIKHIESKKKKKGWMESKWRPDLCKKHGHRSSFENSDCRPSWQQTLRLHTIELSTERLQAQQSKAHKADWTRWLLILCFMQQLAIHSVPKHAKPTCSDGSLMAISTRRQSFERQIALCIFSFFLGYRGIVHPPSADEGTERTWFEPEQRPRKRVRKRSVHGWSWLAWKLPTWPPWPVRSQLLTALMLAAAKGVGGRSNRLGPMGAWWQKS